jgi:hypothetical protein
VNREQKLAGQGVGLHRDISFRVAHALGIRDEFPDILSCNEQIIHDACRTDAVWSSLPDKHRPLSGKGGTGWAGSTGGRRAPARPFIRR